jgi:hypothetical protein
VPVSYLSVAASTLPTFASASTCQPGSVMERARVALSNLKVAHYSGGM